MVRDKTRTLAAKVGAGDDRAGWPLQLLDHKAVHEPTWCEILRRSGPWDTIALGDHHPRGLVGLYDGVPAIMDYKTTAKMKARTSQTVQDYMCQASAYALAHNERFGTDIRTCVVFMVDRSDKFQSFVLNGPAFDEAAERWGQRMVDYLRIVQERGTSLGASLGTSLT
jgi:hypothetical protein